MQFLNVGRIPPQRDWRMPLHVHRDHHELIVVVQGRLQTRIAVGGGGAAGGGQTLVGGPGDVLFYPAGKPHVESAATRSLLETYFVSWRGDEDFSKWPLLHRDLSGHLEHSIRWMYELVNSPHRSTAAPLQCLLELMIHELSNSPRSTENELILRVQHFVQQHLADPLSLDDLATAAGMSRFHFARLFAAATGTSPMAYVRECRIRAARTLLQTTPLPLRTIAPRVGFADQPHLTRVFTRLVGQSPRTFRQWSHAKSTSA